MPNERSFLSCAPVCTNLPSKGFQKVDGFLDSGEGVFVPVEPGISLVGVFLIRQRHSICCQPGQDFIPSLDRLRPAGGNLPNGHRVSLLICFFRSLRSHLMIFSRFSHWSVLQSSVSKKNHISSIASALLRNRASLLNLLLVSSNRLVDTGGGICRAATSAKAVRKHLAYSCSLSPSQKT